MALRKKVIIIFLHRTTFMFFSVEVQLYELNFSVIKIETINEHGVLLMNSKIDDILKNQFVENRKSLNYKILHCSHTSQRHIALPCFFSCFKSYRASKTGLHCGLSKCPRVYLWKCLPQGSTVVTIVFWAQKYPTDKFLSKLKWSGVRH